jgi:hypothetical protein
MPALNEAQVRHDAVLHVGLPRALRNDVRLTATRNMLSDSDVVRLALIEATRSKNGLFSDAPRGVEAGHAPFPGCSALFDGPARVELLTS